MRFLSLGLLALLLLLQYKLWFGSNSVITAWRIMQNTAVVTAENTKMQQRNAALAANAQDLKQGSEAVEDLARTELGMIKKGEVFYRTR
jgi:cell division protein FtsB